MSRNECPCGAGPTSGPAPAWSTDWHRWHEAKHLTAFPDVDKTTRDNLRQFIAAAEAKETK